MTIDIDHFNDGDDRLEVWHNTGGVVPWEGTWQPQCGEEPRPLKAGAKFPRCTKGHPREKWLPRTPR